MKNNTGRAAVESFTDVCDCYGRVEIGAGVFLERMPPFTSITLDHPAWEKPLMIRSSVREMPRADDAGAYVSALINEPWMRDGRHCWRLVIDVQRELFGRELPAVLDVAPIGAEGRRLKPRLFGEHQERARWRETEQRVHGAVVLMHRASAKPDALVHAGVWLMVDGGGVLHCDHPQGVVFDSSLELAQRRWVPRFFVPREQI